MEQNKPIGQDAGGGKILAEIILNLLNEYPGLDGREIRFEQLDADSGVAISADGGALVMRERKSITAHVHQWCQFPFFVVYRTASERDYQKLKASEFLDGLGKWICGESGPVAYPAPADGRRITRIIRSNHYGTTPQENGVQDWLLPVVVEYEKEFDLW